jgi:hypothetical protein
VLTLAIVQGVRGQTQAWPIACYPTFAAIAGDTLPSTSGTSDLAI